MFRKHWELQKQHCRPQACFKDEEDTEVKFGAPAARATGTSGIGSFMGTLRDDHRGRYSVSQRGHPLERMVQLLQ
eukprot:COSAG02_NODE_5263_length_4488_cov_2.690818_1_plen_74_part_10